MIAADWKPVGDKDAEFTWVAESPPDGEWDEGRLIIRRPSYDGDSVSCFAYEPIEWHAYHALEHTPRQRFLRGIIAQLPRDTIAGSALRDLPNDTFRIRVQRVLCLAQIRRHRFRFDTDEVLAGAIAWVAESTRADNPANDPNRLVTTDSSHIEEWGSKLGYDVDAESAKVTFDTTYDFEYLRAITPLIRNGITEVPTERTLDTSSVQR